MTKGCERNSSSNHTYGIYISIFICTQYLFRFVFLLFKWAPSRSSMLSSFLCFTFSNRIGCCVLESNFVFQAAEPTSRIMTFLSKRPNWLAHTCFLTTKRSEQPQLIHKILPAADLGCQHEFEDAFSSKSFIPSPKTKTAPPAPKISPCQPPHPVSLIAAAMAPRQ